MRYSSSYVAIGVALSLALTTPALAVDFDTVLKGAADSGDPAQIETVQTALKAAYPGQEAEIDAAAARQQGALAAAQAEIEARRAEAGLLAIEPWDGKIVGSAFQSSGNSDNAAVGVLFEASRPTGDFVHNFDGFFDFATSDGDETQRRWGVGYQLDYLFTERTYGFVRGDYEQDSFSGFDARYFGGVGVGHYVAKSDAFSWLLEAGPGYRLSLIDDSRDRDSEFAAFGRSETDWLIRDGLLFEQDFGVLWTSPTTTLSSVTSLTTALTDSLSAGVSFEVRFETDPPPGVETTDTTLRANLSYGF